MASKNGLWIGEHIEELESENRELHRRIAELEAELAAAEKRCAELEPINGWTGLPVDESLGEWMPWEVA
jgi:predicted nuclease with TOPRIM domain